jgi:[ribosomal protein S5]-alanine N-acetyltransferase
VTPEASRPPTPTPTLRSKRLLLRAPTAQDAPALLEISYYDGVQAANVGEARRMLEKIGADVARGKSLHWGLYLSGGDLIGTCGFYRGYPDGSGELGYVLKAAFRGQGYMSEALGAVIACGFETLHLERIVAYTGADNRASVAVLERLAFEQVEPAVTGTGAQAAADTLVTFALSAEAFGAFKARG